MWDWRYPIDDIRDEVRKTRSGGKNSASLDDIEKLLDQLTGMYGRLESGDTASGNDKDLDEFIKRQKEVISNSYEQSKQYANIIIIGGYAGIFAIWNFTKAELAKWQTLSVGLCILMSLLLYIVFELYGAWLRTTQVNKQVKELKEAKQLNRFPEEYGKAELLRTAIFMKIWPYFFFSAIGFALIAASILIYSFIYGLVCG